MSFGNSSLGLHLLRGIGGLGALMLAAHWQSSHVGLALALLPLALWLLKGCPMCWTIGLFETIARQFLARQESLPDEAGDRDRAACSTCR
jgi:hypothetical protein